MKKEGIIYKRRSPFLREERDDEHDLKKVNFALSRKARRIVHWWTLETPNPYAFVKIILSAVCMCTSILAFSGSCHAYLTYDGYPRTVTTIFGYVIRLWFWWDYISRKSTLKSCKWLRIYESHWHRPPMHFDTQNSTCWLCHRRLFAMPTCCEFSIHRRTCDSDNTLNPQTSGIGGTGVDKQQPRSQIPEAREKKHKKWNRPHGANPSMNCCILRFDVG